MKPNFQLKQCLLHVLVVFLLFGIVGCVQQPLMAPSAALPASSMSIQGAAAEWRAINRLTYGPTPALLADVKTNGQPLIWALTQLDAARKASLEAPKLPPDLASINNSLPAIFDGVRKEREARAKVPPGTRVNESVANAKRFLFQQDTEPLFFNRTQVNKAVAWR